MQGAVVRALLAALMLSLGGCNLVVSQHPWFSADDALGAPLLRDGLWVMTDDPDCKVREAKPAERWPECADMIVVRGQEWLSLRGERKDGTNEYKWDAGPVLIAHGSPPILQIRPRGSDDPNDSAFTYAALRPLSFDKNGKATALDLWAAQCGPLPNKADSKRSEGEADARYVTDRPFPGLTVMDDNCTADSIASLRNAAALSEALGNHSQMHWVRDGWR